MLWITESHRYNVNMTFVHIKFNLVVAILKLFIAKLNLKMYRRR